MPAILTHYIAGQAVLHGLAPQVRAKIQPCEQLYSLGTQGPDIFFYDIPGALRKRTRGIGSYMHQNDLGLFLVQMAREARSADPTSDPAAPRGMRPLPVVEFDEPDTESEAKPAFNTRDAIFSYTAGFVMHYLVDSRTHPYVYAHTEKPGLSQIANSTCHHRFETAIDIAMLQIFSGKKPADYRLWKLINANRAEMTAASGAASAAIQDIYDRVVSQREVRKAMRCMVQIVRLIQSRKGRRKKLLGWAEKLILGHPLNSAIIHDQDIDTGIDWFNEENRHWRAPWESSSSTDSFLDRYQAAVDEGLQIVQILHDYVYGSLPIETLQEKLGNRSLKTGLPSCHGACPGPRPGGLDPEPPCEPS